MRFDQNKFTINQLHLRQPTESAGWGKNAVAGTPQPVRLFTPKKMNKRINCFAINLQNTMLKIQSFMMGNVSKLGILKNRYTLNHMILLTQQTLVAPGRDLCRMDSVQSAVGILIWISAFVPLGVLSRSRSRSNCFVAATATAAAPPIVV